MVNLDGLLVKYVPLKNNRKYPFAFRTGVSLRQSKKRAGSSRFTARKGIIE